MEYILNITDWNVNLYRHNVLIIGNWTHSQVCSIMLVKTTQYKLSGISSANLLRALEIFDLPPAISPELNKCPGSNPVLKVFSHHKLIQDSQEDFKHLEFSHILHMRRYRIRWKTLKMQKNRKIFQTNSQKSYEILQRIYIRHHMTFREYYQCNTKRKVEVHWNQCKKITS